MSNIVARDGVWYVRIDIPKDVKSAYGKASETISLKTRDKAKAARLAPGVVAPIKARIAELRNPSVSEAPAEPGKPVRIDPDRAFSIIGAWRDAQVQDAYLAFFNGEREGFRDHHILRTLREAEGTACDVEGLTERLAAALSVPLDHPALKRQQLRQWMRAAWADVLTRCDKFARGDFSQWAPAEPEKTAVTPQPAAPTPSAGMKLDDLLERFIVARKPGGVDDLRYAFRRFREWVGDVTADQVTPAMADEFVTALRTMPKTRVPAVAALPMRRLIAEHASEVVLAPKTVWKVAVEVDRVFTYAEQMEFVRRNPMVHAKPKKPGRNETVKDRRAFADAEIADLFSRPMFTGFAGKAERGYRAKAGETVVRDAKFWLPIFALFSGCRLEEIGGSLVSEFVEEGEVAMFDWLHTKRKLKSPDSYRAQPIHPELRRLGFVEHCRERKAAGDIYLFPELDPEDGDRATDQFSKWWGLWMTANDYPDPALDFHSFRHTFKTAARAAGVSEEVHDAMTGHRGVGGVGRDYGSVPLEAVVSNLAKITYPTFPL